VLNALLWGARERGADQAITSYDRIGELAHLARGTAGQAIERLEALGLVQRIKRRVLVLWNNGGRKWRQLANLSGHGVGRAP
jgi:Mn-dependent DtxR family transcriptional regulator